MAAFDVNGTRVWVADTVTIKSEADANELVSAAFSENAQWVAVHVNQLAPEFFRLASGLAGAVVQKLVNYRFGFAVIGDISSYTAKSKPLHDFVWESNRGPHLWFVTDLDEMKRKLGGIA
jgi:hypothetical protein